MHKLRNYELLRDNLKNNHCIYCLLSHLKITWHYMEPPMRQDQCTFPKRPRPPCVRHAVTIASTGRIRCCTGCLTEKEVQRGCSVKKMQPGALEYLVCTEQSAPDKDCREGSNQLGECHTTPDISSVAPDKTLDSNSTPMVDNG
jgi:hypothetical protein